MENIENTEAWRDGYEQGFKAGFDNCRQGMDFIYKDGKEIIDINKKDLAPSHLVRLITHLLDIRDMHFTNEGFIDVDMIAYACAEQHLSITDSYRVAEVMFGSVPFSYEAYTKEGKSNDQH